MTAPQKTPIGTKAKSTKYEKGQGSVLVGFNSQRSYVAAFSLDLVNRSAAMIPSFHSLTIQIWFLLLIDFRPQSLLLFCLNTLKKNRVPRSIRFLLLFFWVLFSLLWEKIFWNLGSFFLMSSSGQWSPFYPDCRKGPQIIPNSPSLGAAIMAFMPTSRRKVTRSRWDQPMTWVIAAGAENK